MQEKNARKIKSLPVIMRKRVAFQKASIPIGIARVQNNNAFSASFKARGWKYSGVIFFYGYL